MNPSALLCQQEVASLSPGPTGLPQDPGSKQTHSPPFLPLPATLRTCAGLRLPRHCPEASVRPHCPQSPPSPLQLEPITTDGPWASCFLTPHLPLPLWRLPVLAAPPSQPAISVGPQSSLTPVPSKPLQPGASRGSSAFLLPGLPLAPHTSHILPSPHISVTPAAASLPATSPCLSGPCRAGSVSSRGRVPLC